MNKDAEWYAAGFDGRRRRVLGAAISAVENDRPDALAVLATVYGRTGTAHVLGVTGPPGVGKSTLVNALIGQYRKADMSVAVVAVDPSSPIGGGAILGDRIRMSEHALDPDVFVRSVASRGHSGGLSRSTARVVDVLDGFGFDVVIVETVGTGQAEIDIMHLAQTVVVVLAPGFGDEVQAIKAGILEIADIFVVNKADTSGASRTRNSLHEALGPVSDDSWQQPIVLTTATEGAGVVDVYDKIREHSATIDPQDREKAANVRARRQLAVAVGELAAQRVIRNDRLEGLADDVLSGQLDLRSAAVAALEQMTWPETMDQLESS
ncbi:MAG: methylmalonyl Co-A mutase-associated GTPase MeaB [Acidimicrobiia bacterium]|nr:MAG: methylmalonyl Co-A mutase-associated GTPase MeaB [Acidimicrobiia bacterium]